MQEMLAHLKVSHPLTDSCKVNFKLFFRRSESSLSLLSLCEGSFGNIQVQGDVQFGFIYNTSRCQFHPLEKYGEILPNIRPGPVVLACHTAHINAIEKCCIMQLPPGKLYTGKENVLEMVD